MTDANHANGIATGWTFVKYFAPWCGHCKRLAPIWAALAHKYKDHPMVQVAEMDCTESETVCGLQGVKGYPSLMLYKDGVLSATHSGGRTLADLDEFLTIHAEDDIQNDGRDEL